MDADAPITIDVTGNDIHAEASRIRARGPVVRVELPGGVLAWSVAGYAAARQALADDRFSKDARRHWTAYVKGEIGPEFPLIAWARMENLSTSHGEDHRRLRKLVAGSFTARRVEAMRSSIVKIVAELLDGLANQPPDSRVDLKARFAHPLAARVIGDLIGVSKEDQLAVLGGGYSSADAADGPEAAAAVFAQVSRWTRQLVAAKRRSPGDDLTSDLIAAQTEDGSRLTDAELVSTLLLLLNTGTEPVTNLVANATWALLSHPEQCELVTTGRTSWASVIEETLRAEAPVAQLPFRFPVEDVQIAGVTIRRGEPVLVNFASAGRDPTVHGDCAARFDIRRANKQHLSFGHGAYRCIGYALAWLEAELALSALFRRFPRLRPAVAAELVEPQGTFIMNGCRELPVYLGEPTPHHY